MIEKPQAGRIVRILPLGVSDRVVLSVVAANLQVFTGLSAEVCDFEPNPEYSFIPTRRQYNASDILKALHDDTPDSSFRLGVVAVDLCLPILSHVFGEALVGGRTAVVSLFRLRRSDNGGIVSESDYLERAAKIAVHEIAHAMGLKHCRTAGCLMASTVNLDKIDRTPLGFCQVCEKAVAASVT